jgi:hypothetical protein
VSSESGFGLPLSDTGHSKTLLTAPHLASKPHSTVPVCEQAGRKFSDLRG